MPYKVIKRASNREKRRLRIRENVAGTKDKPRLSVYRSLRYIYAQLIDDVEGKTLVDVSDSVKELSKKGTKTQSSFEIGKLLAQRAKEKKITEAVFDRGGYKYHGRVKSLADGAREGGLKF
jgi:large subunit ribosomal protein L18